MEGGFTFLTDVERHLWVVLSDPSQDAERVVIVSITTLAPHKEQTCILRRGSHPWVTHDSCVAFGFARIVRLTTLVEARYKGLLRLQEPLSPALLDLIRKSAANSTGLPIEAADILIDQGLLDLSE